MSDARPLYLELHGDPVFALFDRPAEGGPKRTGVLICPPWGWDEVASYRSRRRWAEALAAAGHPVLRIDLPGSGDSGGGPGMAGLLDRWVEAIVLAGGWLRDEAGVPALALLGLGLGALLAEEALARGLRAEELVCWGAPPSGRHFFREMRAFAALQSGRPAEVTDETPALPEGWLEAGGFLLSAETLAALKGLTPSGVPLSRRALLIGRDGVPDGAGAERLAAAGVEVTEDPGVGWSGFIGHPETTVLPGETERVVRGWLGRPTGSDQSVPAPGSAAIASDLTARASFGGEEGRWTEEAVKVSGSFGDAFGILTRPVSKCADHCTVFFNAGAIRHIGPNRLWTEAARGLALAGVSSLRIDLESIGEADGEETRLAQVADFYDPAFISQVTGVLDWLEQEGVARSFRLVGLCAGGYWAFRAALVDERIEAAVLLNAGALVWHPGILEERDTRRLARVFKRRWWRMLMRREVKPSSAIRLLRLAPVGLARLIGGVVSGGRRTSGDSSITADLDALPIGRRLVIAFSGSEPLREELAALGVIARLGQWPDIEVVGLPGADHTLRPPGAQREARELIERNAGAG